MPITEQDIKLLASQRMTDTPDGGGRMTGNVVQSGVDNNIFDDVSNLDRVYGNVSLRKVFAGVLTNDADKYLGARIVVDAPPADPYVHPIIFAASSVFDTRAQTSVRVESYLSQGVSYMGALFGDHLVGQSVIMVQRGVDRGSIGIGDVLVLQAHPTLTEVVTQYVRVTSVTTTEATFETSDGSSFKVLLCACSLSDPLRYNFPGWEAIKGALVTQDLMENARNEKKTQLYETVVADAAQYFGIRPLATEAQAGDFSVKADSVFSPLLPSAQVETPIADARTNGTSAAMVASGGPLLQTITMPFHPGQRMFVGGGVLPSSLVIERDGVTLLERGGVLKNGSTSVGFVDCVNGIITLSVDVFGTGAGTHAIGYIPADDAPAVSKSIGVPVTIASRALNYVVSMAPVPARASLRVSYMAEGNWYTLQDDGTGAVLGSSPSLGAGTLNFQTGTLSVTLGALPDVGSAIILQWTETQFAQPASNADLLFGGKLYFAMNSDGVASEEPGSKALDAGTVVVTWLDGGSTKTATDNGLGALTGDATGSVDYVRGVLRISPNTLPALGTTYALSSSTVARSVSTATVATNGGTVAVGLQPRTVSFPLSVGVNHTLGGDQPVPLLGLTGTPVVRTVQVLDDGAGNLIFGDGPNGVQVVGTVNYTTGVISLAATVPGGSTDTEGVQVSYTAGSASTYVAPYTPPADNIASYATGIYAAKASVRMST